MTARSPSPRRRRTAQAEGNEGPLRSARLDTVLLFVGDFDGMLRFYRDTLGLSVRYSSSHFAELSGAGETTISLHAGRSGPSEPSDSVVVEFGVSDIEGVVDQLTKRGIRVDPIRTESFGRITSFSDPEGHRIGLEQPRKRTEAGHAAQ